MTWKEYFDQTKTYPPRPLLIEALPFLIEKYHALDLGAGALNESRYLLSRGFEHVTAVDKEPLAREIVTTLPPNSFSYIISEAETYEFPKDEFDIVNAQYSLPFVNPNKFEKVMEGIQLSLKTSGIFVGQFFGDRDEWNIKDSGMTFHSKEAALKTLADFESIIFREEEADKPTAAGEMKHWHVFHFIVRK